ncbi:MAG: hypothetical protein ACE5KE_03365 [Methanosarcinales archaeon]
MEIHEIPGALDIFTMCIKADVSSESRFYSDREILFRKEKRPIENFGWSQSGLKEIIQLFTRLNTEMSDKEFEEFYEKIVKNHRGNILDLLEKKKIISRPFYALYVIKITQKEIFPILLINVLNLRYKYCEGCNLNWKLDEPENEVLTYILQKFEEEFGDHKEFSKFLKENFQCLRTICHTYCQKEIRGNCELEFITTENEESFISNKIKCIRNLFSPILDGEEKYPEFESVLDNKYDSLSKVKQKKRFRTKCIERPLRIDFVPEKYILMSPEKWKIITKRRGNAQFQVWLDNFDAIEIPQKISKKRVREIIENYKPFYRAGLIAIPTSFIYNKSPDDDSVFLTAPLKTTDILSTFMDLCDIKKVLKFNTPPFDCMHCGSEHRLTDITVNTIWKNSPVYKQEAGVANLLWDKMWQFKLEEYCEQEFHIKKAKRIQDSNILQRAFKVREIFPYSEYADCDYDFALVGGKEKILFSLTTALWRKGGIHEEEKDPNEYLEQWKHLYYQIPMNFKNVRVIWYITMPETEKTAFNPLRRPPKDVNSFSELIEELTEGDSSKVSIYNDPAEIAIEDQRLIVLYKFRASGELNNLEPELNIKRSPNDKRYKNTLIAKAVDQILSDFDLKINKG